MPLATSAAARCEHPQTRKLLPPWLSKLAPSAWLLTQCSAPSAWLGDVQPTNWRYLQNVKTHTYTATNISMGPKEFAVGSQWEVSGKPMGSQGKPVGSQWKVSGKSVRCQREVSGTPRSFLLLCKCMCKCMCRGTSTLTVSPPGYHSTCIPPRSMTQQAATFRILRNKHVYNTKVNMGPRGTCHTGKGSPSLSERAGGQTKPLSRRGVPPWSRLGTPTFNKITHQRATKVRAPPPD